MTARIDGDPKTLPDFRRDAAALEVELGARPFLGLALEVILEPGETADPDSVRFLTEKTKT